MENNRFSFPRFQKPPVAIIADDDGAIRDLVENFVQTILPEASISSHEDGLPALQEVQSLAKTIGSSVRMIYSDQMMKTHGLDFYKGVRRIPGLKNTPFLMASGGMPSSLREELSRATENDENFRFLEKPFGLAQFTEVTKGLLGVRSSIQRIQGKNPSAPKVIDKIDF
ncbi:MAG: hypothetical protein PHP74_01870 [Candidatus Gracilibacteria bacterium]|nr:hypothetical protein [Candidatus Gracilibacteria bacterium]